MAVHSTLAATPGSYAFRAIVAAYGLAFVPFYYGLLTMLSATKGRGLDYAKPRTTVDKAITNKTISKDVADTCHRAQSAHQNALEGFPFFAAAMLAGTVAGLPAAEMNTAAKQYLASRAVYTFCYLANKSGNKVLGVTRSACWGFGVVVVGRVLWRAGSGLGL